MGRQEETKYNCTVALSASCGWKQWTGILILPAKPEVKNNLNTFSTSSHKDNYELSVTKVIENISFMQSTERGRNAEMLAQMFEDLGSRFSYYLPLGVWASHQTSQELHLYYL